MENATTKLGETASETAFFSRLQAPFARATDDATMDKVPVTVLTGFLGSGKTTLFNHILTVKEPRHLAAPPVSVLTSAGC